MKNWFGIQDYICVLAGGGGLIGSACAKALSDCGARVLVLDTVKPKEVHGEFFKLDMTDASAVNSFFKALKKSRFKPNGWAFINASYPRTKNWAKLGFENVTSADFNKNVTSHLGSAFVFTQSAVKFLIAEKSGGSILNFSSIYGVNGPDLSIYSGTTMNNPVPYAAIKAGIGGLTRYVAAVYGDKNIRANTVCPGGIENNQNKKFKKAYCKRTPLNRMGRPSEIAGTVAFLSGPAAEYITGQNIIVDGGWTAW